MSTSPTTMLSKPTGDEGVPKGTLGYFRARNRHRLYTLFVQEFKKSGLTQAQLSRRLGRKPEVVCRLLATPGNLRADTFSDLLFAISGAVPSYELTYPLEQPLANYARPDWLNQLQDSQPPIDKAVAPANEGISLTMVSAHSAIAANMRSERHQLIYLATIRGSERTQLSAADQQTVHESIQEVHRG